MENWKWKDYELVLEEIINTYNEKYKNISKYLIFVMTM